MRVFARKFTATDFQLSEYKIVWWDGQKSQFTTENTSVTRKLTYESNYYQFPFSTII